MELRRPMGDISLLGPVYCELAMLGCFSDNAPNQALAAGLYGTLRSGGPHIPVADTTWSLCARKKKSICLGPVYRGSAILRENGPKGHLESSHGPKPVFAVGPKAHLEWARPISQQFRRRRRLLRAQANLSVLNTPSPGDAAGVAASASEPVCPGWAAWAARGRMARRGPSWLLP